MNAQATGEDHYGPKCSSVLKVLILRGSKPVLVFAYVCVCLWGGGLADRYLAKKRHWWPFKAMPNDLTRPSPDKVFHPFNVSPKCDIIF